MNDPYLAGFKAALDKLDEVRRKEIEGNFEYPEIILRDTYIEMLEAKLLVPVNTWLPGCEEFLRAVMIEIQSENRPFTADMIAQHFSRPEIEVVPEALEFLVRIGVIIKVEGTRDGTVTYFMSSNGPVREPPKAEMPPSWRDE